MARPLLFFVLLSLAWTHSLAQQAPTCRDVAQMISPCVAYLAGRAIVPYGPCCSAVVALNQTIVGEPDRAAVCGCLRGIAPRLPALNLARAAILPRACGVDLSITISPSLDCESLPMP